MLVLDRKVQEGFWIEGRIFVKVLAVGRKRVKLGVEAPEDAEIVREELTSRNSTGAHASGAKASGANASAEHDEP